MAIARHREKIGMSWQIGSIVRKEKKKGKNENTHQILKKGIDGDCQSHVKSQLPL